MQWGCALDILFREALFSGLATMRHNAVNKDIPRHGQGFFVEEYDILYNLFTQYSYEYVDNKTQLSFVSRNLLLANDCEANVEHLVINARKH